MSTTKPSVALAWGGAAELSKHAFPVSTQATEAISAAQKGNNLQALKKGIEQGKAAGVGAAVLKAAGVFAETGEATLKLNAAMQGQNPDALRFAMEQAKSFPKIKADKMEAAEKRLHALMAQAASLAASGGGGGGAAPE